MSLYFSTVLTYHKYTPYICTRYTGIGCYWSVQNILQKVLNILNSLLLSKWLGDNMEDCLRHKHTVFCMYVGDGCLKCRH